MLLSWPRRDGDGTGAGLVGTACRTSALGAVAGLRRCASDRHQLAQLGEAALADAFHLTQLLNLGEPAVARAPLDDPLGGDRADTGEGVELCGGRGVEIDLGGLSLSRGRRGIRLGGDRTSSVRRRWYADGDLLPIGQPAGQVEAGQVG